MKIYAIDNYKEKFPEVKGRSLTDKLISRCLEDYGVTDPYVLRTDKGKPYTKALRENEEVHLSVSHTRNKFICIICNRPVGIDIQEIRNVSAKKIADRYFTDEEKAYISENGDEGFFLIWTRKEAYSKYTGRGMEEIMKGSDVLNRQDVDFVDCCIDDGIRCSYCIEKEVDNER